MCSSCVQVNRYSGVINQQPITPPTIAEPLLWLLRRRNGPIPSGLSPPHRDDPSIRPRVSQKSSHTFTNSITHLNGQSKPALRDGAPQGSRAALPVYGLRQVGAGDQYWPPGRPHCAFPDRFVTCRAFRPLDDELGNCWVTEWAIAALDKPQSVWMMHGGAVITQLWHSLYEPPHPHGGTHQYRQLLLFWKKSD